MASGAKRVDVTHEAAALIRQLREEHGPLMFHQSGGCCDGSSPMCFNEGELKVGAQDVKLGEIEGCELWMSASQFALWRHTRITLDVVPGRGGGFSLEAPRGVRFLIRSRLFTEEETAELALAGEPPRGNVPRSER